MVPIPERLDFLRTSPGWDGPQRDFKTLLSRLGRLSQRDASHPAGKEPAGRVARFGIARRNRLNRFTQDGSSNESPTNFPTVVRTAGSPISSL